LSLTAFLAANINAERFNWSIVPNINRDSHWPMPLGHGMQKARLIDQVSAFRKRDEQRKPWNSVFLVS
jgi:hypothetical protein